MEHFYQNIGEPWFGSQKLYSQAVSRCADGAHFVEVGSWKGRSACYMAVEIINSQKNILFECVDTWNGSEEHINPASPFFEKEILQDSNYLFNTFKLNILPVSDTIRPIRMSSIDASKNYFDRSLDFVFIDASHEYENVISDILHWLPKVKRGGILSGDDFSDNWPGVKRAVQEILHTDFKLQDCTWVYYK